MAEYESEVAQNISQAVVRNLTAAGFHAMVIITIVRAEPSGDGRTAGAAVTSRATGGDQLHLFLEMATALAVVGETISRDSRIPLDALNEMARVYRRKHRADGTEHTRMIQMPRRQEEDPDS
jgi:hypothetical protein